MIAVQVKDRPSIAVLADMVDGVIAANYLDGRPAAILRDTLWAAVADLATVETGKSPGVRRDAEVRQIRAA